ncbi:hypothetical protein J3R30DRAFT_3706563 [Lentinula aciculospora]|uniref:Uncharacterized protein n=1 Tax=Lentinula aciculospora TaxID=153920 RepID=A0A9W9A5F1_9AGAR|nr:hypothetical protein J3R30DRAFT_3706563 [Lentinula aciculospora]
MVRISSIVFAACIGASVHAGPVIFGKPRQVASTVIFSLNPGREHFRGISDRRSFASNGNEPLKEDVNRRDFAGGHDHEPLKEKLERRDFASGHDHEPLKEDLN